MTSGIPTAKTRRIAFSKLRKLVSIPRNKGRSLVEDVRRISRQLKEANMPGEHLYECIGVELYTHRSTPNHVTDLRREQMMSALILEQRLQRQQGTWDIEKLSFVK